VGLSCRSGGIRLHGSVAIVGCVWGRAEELTLLLIDGAFVVFLVGGVWLWNRMDVFERDCDMDRDL
jgi:hypothetical protein